MRASDPAALQGLHLLWPLRQTVQVVHQRVRELSDFKEPLLQLALLHHCAATPRTAFGVHLAGMTQGGGSTIPVQLPKRDNGVSECVCACVDQLPRQSKRTCSLASTVLSTGSQFTNASFWYARPALNMRKNSHCVHL